MEEIVRELLKRNAELTQMVVELSRELAGVKTPVFPPPSVEMETLYMTEEQEDEEFLRRSDPLHGVDPAEVGELLALTGFTNTNIDVE